MKTVSEVAEAMAGRYDGPIDVVNKGSGERSYIPWTAMVRHLNETFDWDGWGARVVSVVPDQTCYTVALDLEIYVWDERANQVRTIPRPGISGQMVRGGDASDVAGGARSLALVNGARSLGDAFGLYLTPEKSGAAPTSNGHTTTTQGPLASEAQVAALRNCKVPEQYLRGISKANASAIFDRIFADKKTGAYKYGRRYTTEEALAEVFPKVEAVAAGHSDDIPF